jgi:hypothetical protein
LDVIPASRTYHIHLRGRGSTFPVSLPGTYHAPTRTLRLEPVSLTPREAFTVTFNQEDLQ